MITHIIATGFYDHGTTNPTVGLAALHAKALDASLVPDTGHGARWFVFDDFWYLPESVPTRGYGSWLARESVPVVPEPNSLLLVALGLLPIAISTVKRGAQSFESASAA